MSRGNYCDKCEIVYYEDDCPRCTYDDDTRADADFRAFRREIVLSLLQVNFSDYGSKGFEDRIWKIAGVIARAEPKGGE